MKDLRKLLTILLMLGLMGQTVSYADTEAQESAAGETETEAPQETVAEASQETEAAVPEETVFPGINTGLYAKLAAENSDFMFSPYSLKDAFAILYPAAGGASKEQLETVFCLSEENAQKLKDMDASMVFEKGNGVRSANRAFINKALLNSVHPEVLGTGDVDITRFGAGSVRYINKWIAGQTNNRIMDLIPEGAVTSETNSVLVNCLYFLMHWDSYPWHIAFNGTDVPSFSDDTSLRNIKEDGDIDILRLPYQRLHDGDAREHLYAMYIICDNAENTEDRVDAYMNGLTDEKLAELLDFSENYGLPGYTDADYNVPCFEMQNTFSLKQPLTELGLSAPFDPAEADFSRFGDVCISEVVQGTFIRCDDKGTEAAAATAIVLETAGAPVEMPKVWKHVVADSTFAFAIRDEVTGEILFMGRVSEPQYTEE